MCHGMQHGDLLLSTIIRVTLRLTLSLWAKFGGLSAPNAGVTPYEFFPDIACTEVNFLAVLVIIPVTRFIIATIICP